MRVTDKYVFFWDGPFSNFAPCTIEHYGHTFTSSEQLFMWFKANHFNDTDTADAILLAPQPMDAKRLGRTVKGYDDMEWSTVRQPYMVVANLKKYKQNPLLGAELLSHKGKRFVEASPYDKIWGIGLYETDPLVDDPDNWQGANLLGDVLNHVASILSEEE